MLATTVAAQGLYQLNSCFLGFLAGKLSLRKRKLVLHAQEKVL